MSYSVIVRWIARCSLPVLVFTAFASPVHAECERDARTTADAVACLERKIEALRAAQATTAARLAQIGTSEAQVNSGQPLAPVQANILATCPPGHVVKGVKLNVGGTCNNTCDNDGRPVSQVELICTKQ